MGDFWVFGYGSLMWRPGFPHIETVPALLHGVHRALCVYSHVHRGRPDNPGLVLGLDRGGACHGLAFRVEGKHRDGVLSYLREREQTTAVYLETWRKVRLLRENRPVIDALCYVADRKHHQYAGRLSIAEQVAFVTGSVGQSGPNEEYVLRTVAHLTEMGIRDAGLEELAALFMRSANPSHHAP
ncbi:MAG: gamma-glutamylcyclotransferase [Fimbriimonadaceae bacterium]|nr:gamma-glutamylcyclotransferase [Alphaproteobacteria bacterium]